MIEETTPKPAGTFPGTDGPDVVLVDEDRASPERGRGHRRARGRRRRADDGADRRLGPA